MLRKRISIEKINGELCTSGDLQHDTPRQPCLDKILFENFEIKKKRNPSITSQWYSVLRFKYIYI